MTHTCLRCEHTWFPRQKGIPVICPKCGSPYWNKPRKAEKLMEGK